MFKTVLICLQRAFLLNCLEFRFFKTRDACKVMFYVRKAGYVNHGLACSGLRAYGLDCMGGMGDRESAFYPG